jgi:sialic acid synthase SpsE/mannose-6-phosphate isomerase-like protein (cupin superfamily)
MSFFEGSEHRPFLVLDLANNHNGSVEHGKKIIDGIKSALAGSNFRTLIKFQYRDLDTFIHPDYKGRDDIKYIKRFESTRLSWEQFLELADYVRASGFMAACTPFDEMSVTKIVEHKYDVLKIASASFTDWPVLEEAAKTDLPIIASTAGASIEEIDRVVSFFTNRNKDFCLMHCVAAYPTNDEDLQLNRIDFLRERYEGVPIGYSTHENPSNYAAGQMAIAKGARLLERHVGISTAEFPLNDYSSGPETLGDWVKALEESLTMCGRTDGLFQPVPAELEALGGLRRGVFAKNPITKGASVSNGEVFFAIPLQDGQLVANEWSKYVTHKPQSDLAANSPLIKANLTIEKQQEKIWKIVQDTQNLFKEAGITIPGQAELEISHHYGIDTFAEFGLLMVTVVNRDYCKKLLAVMPGQTHPEQYHKQKEETFHCLYGTMDLWLDDKHLVMTPGDVVLVEPGVRHKFSSKDGCVVEEISSTHYKNDSFYVDESINQNPDRKTFVSFWV